MERYDTGPAPSRDVVNALINLPDLVQTMALAVIVDAFREALPAYWCRRAAELETVGTPWADEAAEQCRAHAWLIANFGLPDGLIDELDAAVLGEAA
ncbi:hypothetical protein GCM10009785_33600 [Brooklawnia cerclae]|uniref:Uncharacterized protein n=1 Tax=Brooklawnia cerclae TaxID=349934 RepID=A0ABX0SEV4_9ACTN|nr:hypothetical protein [Brooklawnia cerclae]NIH55725.1 hypothetical protein [Brooklawnia cerclae]